jgi:outer membrane protein assembly factor BamB
MGKRLYIAAEDGNLHVFELKTGKPLWLFHCEGGIGATPAMADGRIILFSRDGRVQALSMDGKSLWRFDTVGERRFGIAGGYGQDPGQGIVPDPWDFWLSSPAVAGGRVVFGSSDGHVYALDAATGRPVWTYDAKISVHSPPAVAGGRVFIGTWDTRLLVLDAADGRLLWTFQGGTDAKNGVLQGMVAAPVVGGDTVYMGARDGFLYAFDAANGTMRWRYDAHGSWVVASAAVDEETVYAATSDTTAFVALDKATGRERFSVDMRVWTYASPVIAGRVAFAAAMDGGLYAFDAGTGRRLWQWRSPEGLIDSEDSLDAKGRLRTDRLFAPGVQLQAAVEKVKGLGAFVASPVWDGRRLIAVTATGQVVVFSLAR